MTDWRYMVSHCQMSIDCQWQRRGRVPSCRHRQLMSVHLLARCGQWVCLCCILPACTQPRLHVMDTLSRIHDSDRFWMGRCRLDFGLLPVFFSPTGWVSSFMTSRARSRTYRASLNVCLINLAQRFTGFRYWSHSVHSLRGRGVLYHCFCISVPVTVAEDANPTIYVNCWVLLSGHLSWRRSGQSAVHGSTSDWCFPLVFYHMCQLRVV